LVALAALSDCGNMLKHFQNQRNRSMRLLVLQSALAIVIGSIWFVFNSPAQGMAFAIGALAVALGQYVHSVVAFTGGVRKATDWFGRFLLAVLLKWLTVFSLMLLGMRWLASAPLAGLAGIVFSLLVIQLFNYYEARVKRGS
jgi:F0F1-type ATP synthase assembly protein I